MSDNEGQDCGDEPNGFPQVSSVIKSKEKSWDTFWRGGALQQLQVGYAALWSLAEEV